MRKYILPALLFLLIFFATGAVAVIGCLDTPVYPGTGPVPADLESRSYRIPLSDYNQAAGGYLWHVEAGGESPPMALVLSDMNSFTAIVNGQEVYAYNSAAGNQRVHRIPLPQEELLEIFIETSSSFTDCKALLGSEKNTQYGIQAAQSVSMLTMGFYITIALYSVSLYLGKPSEKYLLMLLVLSGAALLSALSNSTLPIWSVAHMNQPVRYFRIVFCTALCFRLSGIRLPRRWDWLLSGKGTLLLTGIFLLLYALDLRMIYDPLGYGLALPAAVAVVMGMGNKQPYAWVLLTGTAMRESLRIVFWLVAYGYLPPSIPMVYYYLAQFSSTLFTIACMVVINNRFALKFRQADQLVLQLEEANATMDAKVARRTAQLEEANRQVRKEQEEKRRMVTHIFHDLRSPIFSARGSVDMLEVEDEKNRRTLDIIRKRLSYLGELTEELLLSAKLEEGAITFDHFRVRLHTLCRDICEAFRAQAETRELRLELRLEGAPCTTGDSYHLKKMLENIISNAVKYTPQGGSISVSAAEEGEEAVIRVHNSGQGISPQVMDHIFERYYTSRQGEQSSSGLGLYIASEIVRAHGGTIDVDNQPGSGVCFSVRLPLASE